MIKKYAIVLSKFNEDITNELLDGTMTRLHELGIDDHHIETFKVPGAIEIPLIAKLLAKSKRFQAIIALGAVIRGETSHYDYVCEQVSQGCQTVMLEFEIPVIFGLLTTENEAQAFDRLGGAHGHKGHDAAEAAVAMTRMIDGM